MMKNLRRDGFSIVEISLVLAIAGLIFIMTFIALPALQKSERDTERRESVIKFIDTLKKYQQNNRGLLPTYDNIDNKTASVKGEYTIKNCKDGFTSCSSWQKFYVDYFMDNFEDTSGNKFNWDIRECESAVGNDCNIKSVKDNNTPIANTTFEDNNYTMYIVTGATCDGDTAVKSTNPRKVAVLYVMERVGVYCNNT